MNWLVFYFFLAIFPGDGKAIESGIGTDRAVREGKPPIIRLIDRKTFYGKAIR